MKHKKEDFLMLRMTTQAGKMIFICAILCLFTLPVEAWAAEDQAPEAERVVSLGDIWDGFTGLFSSDEGEKIEKEKAEIKPAESEEEKKEVKKDDGMIRAKRLDAPKESKEQAEVKPYPVYQAPYVEVEAPPPSLQKRKFPKALESQGYTVSGSVAVFTGWENEESKQTSDAIEVVPDAVPAPVSALPGQFFPAFSQTPDGKSVPQFFPLAGSVDLGAKYPEATRAIIAIHDVTRAAGEILATLMTLGGSDGRKTVILAPQFPFEADISRFASHLPEEGRVLMHWPVGRAWIQGDQSAGMAGAPGLSSYTLVDLLALFLSDKARFPSMKAVVVAGHGAGGDFVQRYAAIGRAPDLLARDGIEMRFVVANPSSYLYFSNLRPTANGSAFVIPKDAGCAGFNAYPYGLENLNAYARRKGAEEIRMKYPEKKIYFFVSDAIKSDPYDDTACAAALEGQGRLARTGAYQRHVFQSFGEALTDRQIFKVVKNADYDPVSVFGSSCALSALFDDGACE